VTKTLAVALREFRSTVLTKGFIIGVLMTPVLILIVIAAVALLKNQQGPRAAGSVAVIDRSGLAAPQVRHHFSPEGLKAEREAAMQFIQDTADRASKQMGVSKQQTQMARGLAGSAVESLTQATIHVTILEPSADERQVKAEVAAFEPGAKGRADQTLALVVIPPQAVRPEADGRFGGYDLYLPPKLDFEIAGRIRDRVNRAIVDARLAADERLHAAGIDSAMVRAIMRTPEPNTVTVTPTGERQSVGELAFIVPAGFMILLMISVFTAGQYLLTTTIEEKSSRVMEVLLSAVSPMELMVGKITGQMAVGLLILLMYSGLAVVSLLAFSLQHLLHPMNVVYLIVFFFIAFFLVASLMASIGSAVNELREAQTLMSPVMITLIIPWLLWMPISRAPNSPLATVLSFVPGLNPFVMVIRLSGSEPIPAWQVPASILVGLGTVVFAAWAAAKVFRIGVLMYGKPPNLGTLIKWVRMA
jgi:ABC-2 type transport system permease protein